tara:strand:- start:119 stop:664 length:546 start_codon:yes stop_codon:yes gene_type:complete
MIKYIAIFILLVFCTSCSALQSTHLPCKRRVIEKEELKGLQKDYSITTPKDWQAYYDIHCSVMYLPTNTLNSKDDWNWRRVYLSHVNDTKFYKKYNSVDAFVDDSIGAINERYSNPKIEFSAFKHEIYGEYRVLKFAYKSFFGVLGLKTYVSPVSITFENIFQTWSISVSVAFLMFNLAGS